VIANPQSPIYNSSMSSSHLALMRGINVGGKNKLPMADLAAMFTAAGCQEVRTFIQSGNILFSATNPLAAKLPDLIAAQITKRFGYRTPVVLRTAAELKNVVRANPFLAQGLPEDNLHVLFLADRPTPAAVKTLDPNRSAPDQFIVRGREIYLHLPNGVARSRLTNDYFDTKLSTISTGRNWRTVTKLWELIEA